MSEVFDEVTGACDEGVEGLGLPCGPAELWPKNNARARKLYSMSELCILANT